MSKREKDKKWLFDKGKASGSRKRYSWKGDYKDERNTKENQDFENAPSKSSMKSKKGNRLNYSPLIRFLKSKVGQPWDAVYSELVDRIPKSVQDTNNPIFWYVSAHVEILEDGSIWEHGEYGGPKLISKDGKEHRHRHSHYFVHPKTGILCYLHKPQPSTPKMDRIAGRKKFVESKKQRKKADREAKKEQEENNEQYKLVLRDLKKKNDDNNEII